MRTVDISAEVLLFGAMLEKADKRLTDLLKGYPEYRDDQARGEDGRWSGGGGGSAGMAGKQPKGPGGKKPAKPPKVASPAKVRSARATTRKDASKVKSSLDRVKAAKTEELKRRAASEYQRAAEAIYNSYRQQPREVWYDKQFLDHAWDAVTDLYTVGSAGALSLITGSHLPMTINGMIAGTLALLFAVRYVYRKAVTLGRYRGVRSEDDDIVGRGL